MRTRLNALFEKKLMSKVHFFQLRSVDLPDKFENAIQQTEVKKQDIQKAYAEKNTTIVQLQTNLTAADYDKNVTVNLANGKGVAILTKAKADAYGYKKVQTQMSSSYKALKLDTSMTNAGMLSYLKAKIVSHYNGTDIYLGLAKVDI